jgi:hypothetical protein
MQEINYIDAYGKLLSFFADQFLNYQRVHWQFT